MAATPVRIGANHRRGAVTKPYEHMLEERDDGLDLCLVCGGAEGSMPTKCPGHRLMGVTLEDIYAGRSDFDTGPMDPTPTWWVRA